MVVGPGSQLCTLLEVWVLGVGMSTLGAQTTVRRGSGAPSTDDPGAFRTGSDPQAEDSDRHISTYPIGPH